MWNLHDGRLGDRAMRVAGVLAACLSLAGCTTPGASDSGRAQALERSTKSAKTERTEDPENTEKSRESEESEPDEKLDEKLPGGEGVIDERLLAAVRRGKPVDAFVLLEAELPKLPELPGVRPEHRKGVWLTALKADFASKKERLSAALREIEVRQSFDSLPLLMVRIVKEEQLKRLASSELVAGVTIMHENDLHLGQALPLIRAVETTQWGLRGAGVGIAVLDTGVNFSDRAFGTCSAPGVPGCRVVRSVEVSPNDGSPDDHGHGSSMAQIALSVAPAANLHVFDVSRRLGMINDEDALTAVNNVINTAISANIRALSLSFGVKEYWTRTCEWRGISRNPYQVPFGILRILDVLPVVSTGNDASNGNVFKTGVAWPACTPGAMRVGAVYDSAAVTPDFKPPMDCADAAAVVDAVPCFSQTGPLVSILAPGADITALGRTAVGTSEAAPQVAGAFAVLSAMRPVGRSFIEPILLNNGPLVNDPRVGIARTRLDVASSAIAMIGAIPDDFSAARALSGISALTTTGSYGVTLEAGEPVHAGVPQGGSVWFSWTAPYTGPATVTTAGSDFDTVLAVYTGSSVDTLTEVTANDDASGPGPSGVQFQAQANTTFRIAVSGKVVGGQAQRGVVRLRINGAPTNDALANAVGLPGDLPIGPIAGDNLGATKELGEPHHCGNDGGASVWYTFQPSSWSGLVTATISPTLLGIGACVTVYSSSLSSPTPLDLQREGGGMWATWDDTWSAEFVARTDRHYFIVVEGMSTEEPGFDAPARGTFTLSLDESHPPNP
ncbi:MAG: hypothetical protein EOO73_26465 [Myxococcales bacterium]|nr:MAG: hypothetical protein EOO73_26465 [Myxococcales bacterium]